MILFYDITIHIPYIIIPDWFVSLWLIIGGIGILVQQFSIPLTGRISMYRKFTTGKYFVVYLVASFIMLAFPPISYYAAIKMWRNKK